MPYYAGADGERLFYSDADIAAAAKRIEQPVLCITATGAHSAESLKAWLPPAEFAQVIGSSHFPQLEVPEQVNPILSNFVERL